MLGFLPVYLVWDYDAQSWLMRVGRYACRNSLFYDTHTFKAFSVPFPLWVEVTLPTVTGYLMRTGNHDSLVALVEQWTRDTEGDYTESFKRQIAQRGPWPTDPAAK